MMNSYYGTKDPNFTRKVEKQVKAGNVEKHMVCHMARHANGHVMDHKWESMEHP